MNIVYLNARSLKSSSTLDGDYSQKVCKITLLQHLAYGNDYDVVCVCETWLNSSISNSELLPGYNIYRRERTGRSGGGVLIAVKANLQSTRRQDLEKDGTELVVVELFKSNSKSVILYTFYRPPDSTPDVLHELNSALQDTTESCQIILVGDFNLPAIDWTIDPNAPINSGSRVDEDIFCHLVGDNFLHQFILGPTHIAGNKLDLMLCNCPEIIQDVSTSSPELRNFPTHHYLVEFKVKLKFSRARQVKCRVYDYKHGNFKDLRNSLLSAPFNISPTNNIDNYTGLAGRTGL
jgi:hypothetical protein